MSAGARLRRGALALLLGLGGIYLYCEYLLYYLVQGQCSWPTLSKVDAGVNTPVHAMILADTHLLGSRHGHWFDKLRREWQMHRAFQTALTLHQPELVFVLGDLFDEGLWCSEREFDDYVKRFHRLFLVPNATQMHIIVGNHDIGFHYRMTPHLAKRFEKKMHSPPVQVVSVRGNHFVLVNSMALEGDGCALCARAVTELDRVSNLLKCTGGSALCKGEERLSQYSRPIIMQHFPLYRESDRICTESDAAPLPERDKVFEERWDCLSRESTEYLVESLRPRAVFGGHTHHACYVQHQVGHAQYRMHFTEYSVPSFSWRNRLDPKYLLVTFAPAEFKVSKCSMPQESTMQLSAAILFVLLILYIKYSLFSRVRIRKPSFYKL